MDIKRDNLKFNFTLQQIKKAFWDTFHKSGESFFNYLGSIEDNEKSTYNEWEDYRDVLLDLKENQENK